MSFIYKKTLQSLLNKELDLNTDDLRVILIDTGAYTADVDADNFLDDIAAGARIAVSGTLQNPTIALGVFDADDIVFTAVSGTSIESCVIYKHTGTESTSYLIAYIDDGDFPITSSGGNVNLAWSNGAGKIFRFLNP